jgi:iron complex outermembrane receptor protein
MRNFLLRLIILMIVSAPVFAQTITGKVTTASDGQPLPGVSVLVKGTSAGTTTDAGGQFSISAASGSTLIASFIGFQAKEVVIGNQTVIEIALVEDATQLGEVVVTALGIKRESKSIGYSAQKIEAREFTKASPPDLASGLMGKSAGLNISATNGVQGGSQRIVIRGNNSILGSNQPLIVIDGIQVTNDPIGGKQGKSDDVTSPKDWGSFLNFLNPDEIEDITVLKGANAAALYGARGANGVILITNKRGGKKPGLGLDYNFSTLSTSAYRYMDVQNEYGYGAASALWSATQPFPTTADGQPRYPGNYAWDAQDVNNNYRSGGPVPGGYQSWELFSWYGPAASWGHKLDGTEIQWWDGTKRSWSPQPDNRKAFFRKGNTTTHNLSFSGGGEFGTIRVGLTRLDNKAIVPNSDYNQTNVNLGSSLTISKKVKADVTASYTNYTRLNTPEAAGDNGWTNFMIHGMSRDYKPLELDTYKLADGSKNFFDRTSKFGYYPYNNNAFKDMFWKVFENNQRLTRNQLLGSVKLSADVTPWLNLSGRTSISQSNTNIESKYTPTDVAGIEGQYGLENVNNQDVNFEGFASAHKDNIFGSKFNASILVGSSALRSRSHGVNNWNNGPFSVPNKYYLINSVDPLKRSVEETRYGMNLNSLFGIIDLSYNNYLFLQVTGRNDWSSTLPVATASYFFPSASLSYVFSEAIPALKDQNVLSYGKFKLSAAQSANGTNPYQTQYTYSASVVTNTIDNTAPAAFGGVPVRRLQTTLPPGALLEPQRNKSYEIGAELGFLQNKLNLEFTYYSSKATSQILESAIATSSGASKVRFNTGELANKGFEFIVRATPIQSTNLRWDVTLNGAHNQNKVISLADGIDRYEIANMWGNNGAAMYVTAGQNYGTIYGYDYTYLNGKKVVKRVLDTSDPTKVVGTQYVTTADPVAIGNTTPKLTGGLGNTIRYKNVSLYVLADFKIGGDLFSADYGASIAHGLSPETLKERNGGGLPYTYPDESTANHGVIIDGVFADGTPNTDVVHYLYKYLGSHGGWSNVNVIPRSNQVFTNSWAKVREVTLTYSVPSEIVKRTKFLQGLDISFVGRNLLYIFTTLPENMNPEAINGTGNAQGFQWSQFPGTRDLGFSIKARL